VSAATRAAREGDGTGGRRLMSKVHKIEQGLSDAVIEITDEELRALRETARDADGRKSEVKLARQVLGIN